MVELPRVPAANSRKLGLVARVKSGVVEGYCGYAGSVMGDEGVGW